MAILRDHLLELEITYTGFEDGWVEYGLDCRWDGQPIFRDEPLKRSPIGWAQRGRSQMIGNEASICCLLPFFDSVFRTRQADYVQPIDPDFTLAVWPSDSFPFLPSHWRLAHEDEEHKSQRLTEQAAREAAGGVLDDDRVQVIIAFDAYQYPGTSYLDSGPALHMLPTWRALKTFAEQLRAEFRAFEPRHGIFARQESDDGALTEEGLAWWKRLLGDESWRLGQG